MKLSYFLYSLFYFEHYVDSFHFIHQVSNYFWISSFLFLRFFIEINFGDGIWWYVTVYYMMHAWYEVDYRDRIKCPKRTGLSTIEITISFPPWIRLYSRTFYSISVIQHNFWIVWYDLKGSKHEKKDAWKLWHEGH